MGSSASTARQYRHARHRMGHRDDRLGLGHVLFEIDKKIRDFWGATRPLKHAGVPQGHQRQPALP